jgi:DICT domain-containing protein
VLPRSERPALFAAFQQGRFFHQSQRRWNELARTARLAAVFADFGEPAAAGGPPRGPVPVRVPLPARREWTLVCDSRDYPACVTGWEFHGQPQAADASRRFEVIWSVDPQVVRDAAAICAQLARSAHPGLGPLLASLPSEPPAPASADLRRAAGLLTRMTSYLEKAESLAPSSGSPAPSADRVPRGDRSS